MPAVVVRGETLLTFGRSNAVHAPGAVRIEEGDITHVGAPADVPLRGATEIDLGEAVLLPGLFNAHTHLYSSLARGLSPRGPAPRSFREILENLWWRWDKLLDAEAVRRNAEAGLLESVRCGVTAVNDHHASPNAVAGSLDAIAEAALGIGVRVALAYETSERDGLDVRDRGLDENRRFARRAAADRSGFLAATIGAHASLTLGDESLERLAALSRELGRPVHLHMDEGPEDGEGARLGKDRSTAARLDRTGVLREGTLLAHAVHVDEADIALLAKRRAIVLHNPRSNGANAVGRTPVAALLRAGVRVALGTDGMSADVAADAAVAGAVHRMAEKDRSIPFDLPLRLAGVENAALASDLFGRRFGELAPGFAGDVVARRYRAPTPLRPASVAAHWLLGLSTAPVSDVIVAGEPVLIDGKNVRVDEREILERCRWAADRIWNAFHG
jgi:putative selenium metabolism protein SsnA